VTLIADQHPVNAFTADRAYPPLGVRVRPRRPGRGTQDLDALGVEDLVERGNVLAITIPDQEPELGDPVAEVHHQVPGLLGDPLPCRMLGGSEDVYPPGGDLHQEQDVDAGRADRVDVQEVAGQDAFGLGSEELGPGRPAAPRCGSTPAAVRIVHTVLGATR